jgi:hypothetical protein
MKKPYVSKEILDYLKLKFPNELPSDEGVSLETIRILQGNQEVIKVLQYLYTLNHPTTE